MVFDKVCWTEIINLLNFNFLLRSQGWEEVYHYILIAYLILYVKETLNVPWHAHVILYKDYRPHFIKGLGHLDLLRLYMFLHVAKSQKYFSAIYTKIYFRFMLNLFINNIKCILISAFNYQIVSYQTVYFTVQTTSVKFEIICL